MLITKLNVGLNPLRDCGFSNLGTPGSYGDGLTFYIFALLQFKYDPRKRVLKFFFFLWFLIGEKQKILDL